MRVTHSPRRTIESNIPHHSTRTWFHDMSVDSKCDPRDSLIRKLPGNSSRHLKENLELALLFQAAEIERLGKILHEYRMQHKQETKKQLDRHSYEIQVKELTDELNLAKQKNGGLEKHIQQQNSIIENQLKGSNEECQKIANKYERALRQIQKMYHDNSKLQEEVNFLDRTKEQLEQKFKKGKDEQQNQIALLSQELQRLTLLSKQKEETYQLNLSNKEKELVSRFSTQIQNEEIKRRATEQEKENYEKIMMDYEERIKRFQSEKLETIHQWNQKIEEIEQQMSKRSQNYHATIHRKESEVENLNTKLQNLIEQMQQIKQKSADRVHRLEEKILSLPTENKKNQEYELIYQMETIMNEKTEQITGRLCQLESKIIDIIESQNSRTAIYQLKKIIQFLSEQTREFHKDALLKIETHNKLYDFMEQKGQQIVRLRNQLGKSQERLIESQHQIKKEELEEIKHISLEFSMEKQNLLKEIRILSQQNLFLQKQKQIYEIKSDQKLKEQREENIRFQLKIQELKAKNESLSKNTEELKNDLLKVQESLHRKTEIISEYQLADRYSQTYKAELEQAYKIIDENKTILNNLEKTLEAKLEQIEKINVLILNYKSKYEHLKNKLLEFDSRIDSLLKSYDQEDHAYQERIQNMKKTISKIEEEKATLIGRYQKQIQKLREESYMMNRRKEQEAFEKNRKIDESRIEFMEKEIQKLSERMKKVQEQNYRLTCWNYQGNTEDHVKKNFSSMKVQLLSKEITRLEDQNQQLKQEIMKWKIEAINGVAQEKRIQQNLSTLVLAFTEIESLRNQLQLKTHESSISHKYYFQ